MKYNPIDAALFVHNRNEFYKLMLPGSLAIFTASDIYPTSADGTLPFVQSSDFFYLSGIDQAESLLLLFPEALEKEDREILFIKKIDEKTALWEGEKLTQEKAQKISGIANICFLEDFEAVLKKLAFQAENIYLNSNEHLRNSSGVSTREERLVQECKAKFPLHNFKRGAPLLHRIRAIKHPLEIALLQKAIDLTERAFRRVLSFIKSGLFEYEIEAEFIHEFTRAGASGFAYQPILGGGKNSCVLHYIDNNQKLQNGEVLLMDVGARYAHYNADITRTIPISGRFTPRQKAVYEAVLRIKKAAEKLLQPGIFLKDYQQKVGALMLEELLQLGLLSPAEVKQNPLAYKKYFMHGTSHFLGLDVHDVGLTTLPLVEGMVLTVEPGIYIPEEGLGIRLEDNILLQKAENINLSKNIPIEITEIEEQMNKR